MEKTTVVKSLIYKFTERFAVKGIGFLISILLARLLAPEHFGEIALITVFTEISLTIVEGGLSSALVQSRVAEDRDYSTVFYITLALSLLMIALLQLAAPAIGRYYKSSALVAPLRVYSLSMLFSSFNSIQVARLQREMRFREMMLCNLAATVISGSLAILLAMRGAGLWALVIYFFAQIVASCAAMLFVLRWLPKSPFSPESARRLYGFGIRILAAELIATIYNNLRQLLIGKAFSTTDLGYYNRGQNFASTISLNLDRAFQSVMFPVLSRAQDDTAVLLGMLRRTKKMGTFVLFPIMLGMAAVAEPMVRVLLTDKWLPAVPYVVLLSIGDALVPLTTSNLVLVKAMGRSDIFARQEVVRRILMLIVLAVSFLAFRSVLAIAVGFVFSAWLDFWVTSLSVKKLIGYSFLDQLRDVWRSGLSALIMAAVVYAAWLLPLALPPALELLLLVLLGAAVYILVNILLRNESFFYMVRMLRNALDRDRGGDSHAQ